MYRGIRYRAAIISAAMFLPITESPEFEWRICWESNVILVELKEDSDSMIVLNWIPLLGDEIGR